MKYVLFSLIFISSMHVYCAASCTGLQNQRNSVEIANQRDSSEVAG